MKPFLKGGFTLFGAAIAPALYLSGASLSSVVPVGILYKNIDWNWKNWVEVYNRTDIFGDGENAEALLARAISKDSKIEKVFINENTKYLKNRQIGIKILALDSYKGDYGISPYKVFIANDGQGNNDTGREGLGEDLAKKIHIIEWEGTKEGSSEEQYRGVIAVSFVPANKLEALLKQLNEQDKNLWDIDVRDILKGAAAVDHTFGKSQEGKPLSNLLDQETIYAKIGPENSRNTFNETTYDENQIKDRLFVQALKDETIWVKRSWYKGGNFKKEGKEEELEKVELNAEIITHKNPKYEITIPDKYLLKEGKDSWLEFNENLINKRLKIENGRDKNIVIDSSSESEKVIIDKKALSTNFLIRRRNINVLRKVIKEIFKWEGIESLDLDKTTYSYLELLGLMKRKFVLDKFRDLHWDCAGNEIPDDSGWIAVNEDEGEEEKKETPKFCGKWDYPIFTDYAPDHDPVIELSDTVWESLEREFKKATLPLCGLIEKEINPYLNSVYGGYKTFNPESCEIKPKTQIVSEHEIPKNQELTEDSIKKDVIELPDKFGIYAKNFKDNKFTESQETNKDKLVPIVWSNKSFVKRDEKSGWTLSFNEANTSTQEEHKKVKIVKIKEWKIN